MTRDAAECLQGLVAAGAEIPYEVREPGNGSPLCRYEPLTEVFVRDHAGELRELDSFGAACAALESAGLCAPYLERMGIAVPSEPRRRAELAALGFLCWLWMDTSDFSVDDARLEAALEELEVGGEASDGQIEVIVPLRGLQLPVARLDLATASIVRADTVEVPAEARSAEGLGVSPWEPTFLAVVRVDGPDPEIEGGGDPGFAAVLAFRRLVTTLRLFKAGGVGLGPHAWTRLAGDRWRRIATGCGRQRPGGYRLAESELGDLISFSRTLDLPGTPFSRHAGERPGFPAALGRAMARFEAGLERNVVIEALSDHLLALRYVLEGGGPAALGLPMRVAALCAEPNEREDVKAVVDRALGLERELWSGEPAPGIGAITPAETATVLEELARAILKDAAVGHLGSDLRATADEILLADGLAVGDGAEEQRGGTTEWDLEPIAEDEDEELELETYEHETLAEEVSELDRRISPAPKEETMSARAREIFEPGGEPESLELIEPAVGPRAALDEDVEPQFEAPDEREPSPVLRLIEQTRAERRAHHERVAGLFPRPETTEWNVREIAYDRNRRARV